MDQKPVDTCGISTGLEMMKIVAEGVTIIHLDFIVSKE